MFSLQKWLLKAIGYSGFEAGLENHEIDSLNNPNGKESEEISRARPYSKQSHS